LAIAIDPEHFASRKSFTELVDRMVAGLRNVKTLPGVEAIRVPGERAANERHIRQVDGIPLSSVMRNELATVLLELDLIDKYRNVLDGRTQA
jgi:LDH2 family malate/lactate/ureidoglycolate dehydrogenase